MHASFLPPFALYDARSRKSEVAKFQPHPLAESATLVPVADKRCVGWHGIQNRHVSRDALNTPAARNVGVCYLDWDIVLDRINKINRI